MKKHFVEKYNASDDSFGITEIYFESGKEVNSGDIIFSIESSKADIDIEVESSGYLYHDLIVGEKIKVGDLFYIISDESSLKTDDIIIKNDKNILLKGITISKKAKEILKKHNISAELLNKKLIKEIDVMEYIALKAKPVSPILDDTLLSLVDLDVSKAIIIIGAKGGAKMAIDALRGSNEFIVVGLIDDAIDLGTYVMDVPVVGNTHAIGDFIELGIKNFIMAFGILENRKKRFELFNQLKKLGCQFPNIIHPKAIVEDSVIIGQGNVILAGANVGSCVKMGDLNYINNSSLLSHDCILVDNIHIAPGAVLASSVVVESHVLIGMNTTLFLGINIGEGASINNGLVVNSNVKRNTVQKS
tara:strand:+ start:2459 stop:3538 length:1080 start_codon:yes stop_codon:yes gene_type:complete